MYTRISAAKPSICLTNQSCWLELKPPQRLSRSHWSVCRRLNIYAARVVPGSYNSLTYWGIDWVRVSSYKEFIWWNLWVPKRTLCIFYLNLKKRQTMVSMCDSSPSQSIEEWHMTISDFFFFFFSFWNREPSPIACSPPTDNDENRSNIWLRPQSKNNKFK